MTIFVSWRGDAEGGLRGEELNVVVDFYNGCGEDGVGKWGCC